MLNKNMFNKVCFSPDDFGPWGRRGGDPDKNGNSKKSGSSKKENNIVDNVNFNKNQKSGSGNFWNDLKNLLGYEQNNSNGGRGNSNDGNGEAFIPSFSVKNIMLAIMLVITIWLVSGFYKVGTDENAVVLYFGKYNSIATPGLNYHIPAPIGKAIKVSVTRINKEEFGFNSSSLEKSSSIFGVNSSSMTRDFEAESLMLTGDENIADIDFEVQWRISDVKDYLFNLANPQLTVRKATESAMREIIAKRPIDDALAQKKSEIEREVRDLVQSILDSYNGGVEIVLVQLLRVDPPEQVINAFRDVQTAKADKERKINEAQIYTNDILPRAKGQAEQILQEAEGYKQSVIANAEGEASRFNQVYNEYRKAKTVTRKRMYLDSMQEIMTNADKVIIEEGASKTGVVPYLPISNK